MAVYYVSNARGDDSTGTGSALAPWKTINRAVGSSSAGITLSGAGDTLYIEPGVYREAVNLGLSPTAAGPLAIVGDVYGTGFLAGGYATPATGKIDWRCWNSDDVTTIAGSPLTFSNKGYVTLRSLKIIAGNSIAISAVGDCPGWTFDDCVIVGPAANATAINWQATTAGVPLNLAFLYCTIYATVYNAITIQARYHTADYDLAVLVEGCEIHSTRYAVSVGAVGTSTAFLPHGVVVRYCSFTDPAQAFNCYQGITGVTLSAPNVFKDNRVIGGSNGIVCGNASQVSDQGNIYHCLTPVVGCSLGANSITSAPIAYEFSDWAHWGLGPAPYLTPSRTSAGLGLGDYSGSPPSSDLTGRRRPEGFGSAAMTPGAFERHDTGDMNSTYADSAASPPSAACMALVGPSSQERPLAVDAVATTIRVKVRWDGNHGDGSKPQAVLVANPEIGIASDQTLTASSAGGSGSTPNAYETLTFAPITPTVPGVVMLRMVSRSAAGNGAAYFDTITFS